MNTPILSIVQEARQRESVSPNPSTTMTAEEAIRTVQPHLPEGTSVGVEVSTHFHSFLPSGTLITRHRIYFLSEIDPQLYETSDGDTLEGAVANLIGKLVPVQPASEQQTA